MAHPQGTVLASSNMLSGGRMQYQICLSWSGNGTLAPTSLDQIALKHLYSSWSDTNLYLSSAYVRN